MGKLVSEEVSIHLVDQGAGAADLGRCSAIGGRPSTIARRWSSRSQADRSGAHCRVRVRDGERRREPHQRRKPVVDENQV